MPQESLRDALASRKSRGEGETRRPVDTATREAIARESTLRYRRLVSELNRARDSDIDRATLRRS